MQVTMFQSAQGDCLLLSDTGDKTRILVDGGMPAAYTDHVAATLTKFRKAKKKIDLLYVSHVDQDHIGGVLRMLDDEVLWRVHEHQKSTGNTKHKPPAALRPPEISEIWHNSFHDQLKKNAGPIEELLAAAAPILSAAEVQEIVEAGQQQAGLITSIAEAIRVSRRISASQLNIKLNAPAKGKMMMRRSAQGPIKVGGFKTTILGPSSGDLEVLRKAWNKWLKENGDRVKALRKAARADEKKLGASEFDRLLATMVLQAEAFGNPASVTPPNIASLTLLVEEGGKTILLTGDAKWDQVIDGLAKTGHLQANQPLAIDIIKVPHHGSENNVVETTLLDRTVGKHYVFCGNGHSSNPEVDVVELMVKHRMKQPGNFKYWFNCSEAVAEPKFRTHMREVEKTVKRLASKSGGRMTFKFLDTGDSLRVV